MPEKHLDSVQPVRPSLDSYLDIIRAFGCNPETLIHIVAGDQELRLYQRDSLVFSCPVSTSSQGLGERKDSFQTPRGLHQISEILGTGEPKGRIFKSRIPEPEVWPANKESEDDLILSRILWLEGLERGRNREGDVDTKSRFIYLHGTNHEGRIGSPASAGCIRLTNPDILTLADQWAQPGQLCLIEE
jgi:hypothetical protein